MGPAQEQSQNNISRNVCSASQASICELQILTLINRVYRSAITFDSEVTFISYVQSVTEKKPTTWSRVKSLAWLMGKPGIYGILSSQRPLHIFTPGHLFDSSTRQVAYVSESETRLVMFHKTCPSFIEHETTNAIERVYFQTNVVHL